MKYSLEMQFRLVNYALHSAKIGKVALNSVGAKARNVNKILTSMIGVHKYVRKLFFTELVQWQP